MSNLGDERGQSTEPPPWWIEWFDREYERRVAENAEAKRSGRTEPHKMNVVALGAMLADEIGRSGAWHHSAVSNFINGVRRTREMALAFCSLWGLPRFEAVVRAETMEKALDLEAFLRKFEGAISKPNPDRMGEADARAQQLSKSAEDQGPGVSSHNERAHRSGRPRRPSGRS